MNWSTCCPSNRFTYVLDKTHSKSSNVDWNLLSDCDSADFNLKYIYSTESAI